MDSRLIPANLKLLTGEEPLLPGVVVRDFWAWALGDLRLNAARGLLSQFLVAKAIGDVRPWDDGWGNFDVLSPEGARIEVKTSGFLQSWSQTKLSTIGFSGLWGRSWDAETGLSSLEPVARADVFVFAVHTCMDHAQYDPLDLGWWEFHVISAKTIYALRQKTIRLSRLKKLPGLVSCSWEELNTTVRSISFGE